MPTVTLTKRIRKKSILRIIEDISQRGARPISIVLKTDVPLLKKNRETRRPHHYGDIAIKIAKYQAFVNFDYQNAVNAQRVREGKSPTFRRKTNWFKHSNPEARALLCLPGEPCNYLQLKIEKRLSEKFVREDGRTLQKRWIENLLPARSTPKQGLAKPVFTITPMLESIKSFTCDGVTYEVV